jgi:hypothetical protein
MAGDNTGQLLTSGTIDVRYIPTNYVIMNKPSFSGILEATGFGFSAVEGGTIHLPPHIVIRHSHISIFGKVLGASNITIAGGNGSLTLGANGSSGNNTYFSFDTIDIRNNGTLYISGSTIQNKGVTLEAINLIVREGVRILCFLHH